MTCRSSDPAGLAAVDPSNPQTWNRYAYVTNNPASFVDPTGMNMKAPGQGGCDSEVYDCGSSGGSPSSPGVGGATDFSAIGNSSDACPICSGPYNSLGTAGFADGFFNVTNGGPGSGFGSPSSDLSAVIFNYTTNSEGYLVGDYAGELLCPTGWGCTVWNPNTRQWEEPTVFNCAGCAGIWRNASGAANTAYVATGVVLVGVPLIGEAAGAIAACGPGVNIGNYGHITVYCRAWMAGNLIGIGYDPRNGLHVNVGNSIHIPLWPWP
jgi:hypothetical protein